MGGYTRLYEHTQKESRLNNNEMVWRGDPNGITPRPYIVSKTTISKIRRIVPKIATKSDDEVRDGFRRFFSYLS